NRGIAQEAHRADEEESITAHGIQDFRPPLQDLLGGGPVGGDIVLTAQPEVIYPGRVSDVRADVRRNPVLRLTRSGHFVPSSRRRARLDCAMHEWTKRDELPAGAAQRWRSPTE